MTKDRSFKPMEGTSSNLTEENINQLKALFPEVVTEGKIDFDVLKTILGEEVDESEEKYKFTWHGKLAAMQTAQQPTMKTLLPQKQSSLDWENTGNIYIEGDNLDALKIIQKSYAHKVKVIYIDPPYNTGKDFVYHDDFSTDTDSYLAETNQTDSLGSHYATNTESNGKFHTDWLNMMYSRLKLAQTFLRDDGVIFVSIDDSEQANLKKMMDEIFGEQNFLAQVIWERAYSPVNLKKNFSISHDYILVYARNAQDVVGNGLPRSGEADSRYNNPDHDERGVWTSADLSVGPAVESNVYPITLPSGRSVLPPNGYSWRLSKPRFNQFVDDNRIWFGEEGDGVPRIKRFLSEVKNSITPMTVWKYEDVGHSQKASQDLKRLFSGKAYFSYPKPVELIQRMLQLYSNPDSIVMDFFSGSATTAEATMRLNAADAGTRRYILVQLPEKLGEKTEAYKDGYRKLTEIGEKRIQLAGETIAKEHPEVTFDRGVRVYSVANSNLVRWNVKSSVSSIDFLEENFVTGRSSEAILTEVILKQGLDLSYPVETRRIDGADLYIVAGGVLYVVLGNQTITLSTATAVADDFRRSNMERATVVFQDNGFKDDNEKLNAIEILNDAGFQYADIQSI